MHFCEMHGCSTSERAGCASSTFGRLAELAQSRDTLISHIDSLLIHFESLGLCANMQKTDPSQSITYLGVCLDSVEMRTHLSRERTVAILSSLCIFRQGSSVHWKEFQRLLGLMASALEVRAPSTRCLYALKWGVFVEWCGQAHIDPATCTVPDVLSFLQYRLDSGLLPSTLKVYVAAFASFHSPQGGQSIGRLAMVVSFLKGVKRLLPPRPPFVPPWDLEVVLRAL